MNMSVVLFVYFILRNWLLQLKTLARSKAQGGAGKMREERSQRCGAACKAVC